jgi:UDP-N-acetylglucosamine--N-acetylmuramyl-(pentapeptide) pyrophosphoryl-undecaprenol N-acetylglucosamine transferase
MLAIANYIKKTNPKTEFLLVGTKTGPERAMAEREGIKFIHITSGKWRRYFSLKNIATPFQTLGGLWQSIKILKDFKPDCIFATGSFVQVPLIWAAWVLKLPVVLHQQDVVPSLANKLCQFAAAKITVTFPLSSKSFSSELGLLYKKRAGDKIVVTGNPFREELLSGNREAAQKSFNLHTNFPTLLVLGGGTGAEYLNKLILDSLSELTKTVQIIHSTGRGKFTGQEAENYHPYEFVDNMAGAYAAADIVLARAGLSTLTELSFLQKLSIIVPMPESHQELNGMLLSQLEAAIVVRQKNLNSKNFVGLIRKVLFANDLEKMLKHNIGKIMPHEANAKISEIIIKLAKKS